MGQGNSLDALCKRYSVDNSQRDLHGALLDAHLLAQVYLAMTGGQSSLFDSAETAEANKQESIEIQMKTHQPRNLLVISATSDEIAEHEQKLQKMSEKGKCLWLQD